MKLISHILIALIIFIANGCMVVRPGEVGYLQRAGHLTDRPFKSGLRVYNPFITRKIKINVQIVEVYEELIVPSKEGLSVNSEISLLYHIDPDKAREIYTLFGTNYQQVAVVSNLRATAREICARYAVKELYATERIKIEKAIADQMNEHIGKYGFVIDAVLLRDIVMPKEITQAIERKVEAEQATLTMDFVISKQRKEAERVIIEADGIKKSQEIINQAMTPTGIQYRYIEMLKSLGLSPNAKILMMDKQAPIIVNP